MSKIDRNRGVIQRKHPAGYRVAMYVDSPGVYFDENANKVTKEVAEAAGFDVKADRKSQAKLTLRANYERQIGAKFAAAEQRIDELMEENPDILEQLKLVEVSKGRFVIQDGDDNTIIDQELGYEDACALYQGITGNDWVSDADDPPNLTNPYMDMKADEVRKLLKAEKIEWPKGIKMPKLAVFALEKLGVPGNDLL